MRIKIIVLFICLLFVSFVTPAQEKISLLDADKVKIILNLSNDQFKIIKMDIDKIKGILEEDKNILSKLRERFKNDDEPGFFEKISVKRGRDKRSDKIEDLIEDIEDQLNTKQKLLYRDIEKPGLKSLSKKELTE
ncbi:MAG: hypothetical protein WC055_13815 [Melioribacteraceae bacterium]